MNIIASNTASSVTKTSSHTKKAEMIVSFTRQELSQILTMYGFFVSAGDWKDYAIDCLKDRSVFSIYRRASESPLFRIEKEPKLARKQGAFVIYGAQGQVMKRGNDLSQALKVFDRMKLKLAN